MTDINPRLRELFEAFCDHHCKHRRKKTCKILLKRANLVKCPIPQWWDINDYLNDVSALLTRIKKQYEKEHVVTKMGSLSDLDSS